jgi:hypothetical protein
MDKCVDNFNNIIRKLLADLENRHPDNDTIYRQNKRLSVALQSEPTLAIQTFGPELWNNREKILNREEKYFLDMNFEDKLDEDVKQLGSVIDLVKRDFVKLSKTNKDKYINDVINMLTYYVEYIKLERDRDM